MSSPATETETRTAWHALDLDAVAERLDSTPSGLATSEAHARLARIGPNELETEEPPSNLTILARQFTSPLIWILLIAAVVTLAIGEYIDTGVIAAVLGLNAVIGFTQERKADRSVRALMQLAAPRSRVLRDGGQAEVDSRELVPGDVVLLESGTRVPADLRLLSATALRVDESLLTGESLPVDKKTAVLPERVVAADRSNMAFMGSVVTSGRGRGYVVETSTRTELGAIAERIRTEESPRSPLQRRMHRFANVIAAGVGGAAVAAFVLGVAVGEPATTMFMTGVALAVAIVPEGLPIAFTVAMALGVRRMARRNAIVRTLPAVETLGSTNVIGSDKTGTLTENRMTVTRIWAGGRTFAIGDPPDGEGAEQAAVWATEKTVAEIEALRLTLQAGVLTNEAEVCAGADGQTKISGDPTEAALLSASAALGSDPDVLRALHPVVSEQPFEPDLRYSASVRAGADGQALWVKGAPERVMDMCTRMASDGDTVPVDRAAVGDAAHQLAQQGLRVLAMAYRPLGAEQERGSGDEIGEPAGLVLLGLQGMRDPPRPGVRDAIAGCNEAGIRVVMVTGDHAATARTIAADLGITDDDGPVLTGVEIDELDDEELDERTRTVRVYARVSPEHKHRIVLALRRHGEVVAVTGDGVNDAPALKAADIGIAMGRSGTDVAKEAANIVLTDDNFVSIYAAVEEGRVVFDNVRKVTFFLLSTGVAAIVAILFSLVAGWPLPLLPAQLLWLNVVTNGLQDVALAFEPGERGVLRRPPRSQAEGVVSPLLWERTALTGVTMAIGALWLFDWSLMTVGDVTRARTVALTTLVVFMAFHVYNARSERRSLFALSPLRNPFLLAATTGALLIHVLALQWAPTQLVLRVEPLEAGTWLRVVVVAATVVVVSEAHKLLRRPRSAPTAEP